MLGRWLERDGKRMGRKGRGTGDEQTWFSREGLVEMKEMREGDGCRRRKGREGREGRRSKSVVTSCDGVLFVERDFVLSFRGWKACFDREE